MIIRQTLLTLKTNKLWFWSDPHFYHKNVIKYCDRPYSSVEEMNEALIENYNSVVKEGDTCIWVGDCFFCSKSKAKEIMNRLNGKKILISGNHDRDPMYMRKLGFDLVLPECWLNLMDRDVQIIHYPFKPSNFEHLKMSFLSRFLAKKYDRRYPHLRPRNKGQFLIHGHTHQKNTFDRRSIHVGVDSNNYTPVSCELIMKYIYECGL